MCAMRPLAYFINNFIWQVVILLYPVMSYQYFMTGNNPLNRIGVKESDKKNGII